MLEMLKRMEDVDGLPKYVSVCGILAVCEYSIVHSIFTSDFVCLLFSVFCFCCSFFFFLSCRVRFSEPSEFFSAVEDQDAKKLCKWRGELYLELHRGTYTTQAKVCMYIYIYIYIYMYIILA